MTEDLQNYFGHTFESELLEEIKASGNLKKMREGETLMEIGQDVNFMPLLLSGIIKISREDADGNELLLYFLEKGDTCAMTLTCCMGNSKSEIRAGAETNISVLFLPVSLMDDWMVKYKTWRQFVLQSYNNRFMEVLETLDSIAFMNMDARLLKYLEEKVRITRSRIIEKTHQQIAADLNTSRVVISRLLKNLEKKKVVSLNRNNIEFFTQKGLL